MIIVLALHPIIQLLGISLALFAAYLGWQRVYSLHFGKKTSFDKKRHVVIGSLALFILLGGMAGGKVMVSYFLENMPRESLHAKGALTLLPILLFGILSGFFLYLKPGKRKILPALHAVNNITVLFVAVFQIITGLQLYFFLIGAR